MRTSCPSCLGILTVIVEAKHYGHPFRCWHCKAILTFVFEDSRLRLKNAPSNPEEEEMPRDVQGRGEDLETREYGSEGATTL